MVLEEGHLGAGDAFYDQRSRVCLGDVDVDIAGGGQSVPDTLVTLRGEVRLLLGEEVVYVGTLCLLGVTGHSHVDDGLVADVVGPH